MGCKGVFITRTRFRYEVGIVISYLLQICNRVKALDRCQNFVSTRYHENKWTEFDLTEAVLTSTHNLSFRAKIRKNVYPCTPQFYYTKVGCKGVFITRTRFRYEVGIVISYLLQICNRVKALDRCQNFVSTRYHENKWTEFDLTEAVLTSTHNLSFRAKIRKNVYPCTPQFYYTKVGCKGVFVTRTRFRYEVGIVNSYLLQTCNRVKALDRCQNFVSTRYHENKWTEFDQILYTH